MSKVNELEYDKWMIPEEAEQKKIARMFRTKGTGLLVGYVLLLVFVVVSIVINILFQKINLFYIVFFLLIALASVAGIGNQVKLTRQMKQHAFEVRDGIVKKLNYTNKRKYNVYSYEVEIDEHNVVKTIVVSKGHRGFKPKEGDHVLLAKPQKSSSIYFYKKL